MHEDGGDTMSQGDEWSPDESLGTETFEQGDDAMEEYARIDPKFSEILDVDPSLDPHLQVDHLELEELGAELDDPEKMAVMDGGIDDPDGIEIPVGKGETWQDEAGWDLNAPLVRGDKED